MVRFYAADQSLLPDMCIKTGARSNDRVDVTAYYRPSWPVLLAPFSLLAASVGLLAGSRRFHVSLPFSDELARRYRLWKAPTLSMLGVGLALVVTGSILGSVKLATAGLVITAAAAIAVWINLATHTCAVSANVDGTVVTVRRCSRDFKSAVKGLSD